MDYIAKAEKRLDKLMNEGKEDTEEFEKWEKCFEGLHTKLTMRFDFTYDDGLKVKEVCENCGEVVKSFSYNVEVDETILKSDGEIVDRFTLDEKETRKDG